MSREAIELPDEVKKKIEDEAVKRYPEYPYHSKDAQKKQRRNQEYFIEGAKFGYTLFTEEAWTNEGVTYPKDGLMNDWENRGAEGEEDYPGRKYQRLFNAIGEIFQGIAIQSEMDEIIQIVKEDFLAPESSDQ